jgi:nucleotide-binding universal stress UspA family protein
MSTSNKTHPIVVGIDYTELGDLALQKACTYAGPNTHLHVVHVVASSAPIESGTAGAGETTDIAAESEKLRGRASTVIKNWCDAESRDGAPFQHLTTHVRSGHPAEELAQLASDVEAELVVVGTHGRRGAKRFLLGSVAENTVRIAPCAVLVARPANAGIPEIEPPCPQCLQVRQETNGEKFWCERHAQHHSQGRTHHYRTGTAADRSSGFLIHR